MTSTSEWQRTAWAALLYAALTAIFAYPLPLHLASHLFATGTDPQLWMWTLAWDTHAFTHQPFAIFDANTFYPAQHALAYSESLIGSAFFAAPVLWLTSNPVLAMNLLELASAFFCALGTYVLARRAGLRPAGAVLAGMIFGFAPSRFLRIDQFHITTVQWVPFGLAFLHAYLDTGRKRDLRIFLAFLSLQTLTSGHGAVFLVVGSIALVVYKLAMGEPVALTKRLRDVGVIGVLILVPAALLFLAYRAGQAEAPALHRTLDDFGVSAASYFDSSSHLQEWVLAHAPSWFTTPPAETELFPSYLPVLLSIAALWLTTDGLRLRSAAPGRWWKRGALALELSALALTAVAAAVSLSGDTKIKAGATVLFTARHVWRIWTFAAIAAAARLAIVKRVPLDLAGRLRRPIDWCRRWWPAHRRDIAVFYALLTLLSFWLTLGPPIGLWRWVYWLPVMNFLRVPQRFVMLEILGLAILGGLGFERLTARLRPAARAAAAVIVGLALVGEFAAFPLGTEPYRVDLPAIDRWLDTQPKPFVVAEIPMPRTPSVAVIAQRNTMYMLHSMAHWQKTVHGFSGVEPPSSTRLFQRLSRFPDDDCLSTLVDMGVTYLVMHTDQYRGNELQVTEEKMRAYQDWMTLEHVEGTGRVYAIHRPGQAK